jgi:hypothetical protein
MPPDSGRMVQVLCALSRLQSTSSVPGRVSRLLRLALHVSDVWHGLDGRAVPEAVETGAGKGGR